MHGDVRCLCPKGTLIDGHPSPEMSSLLVKLEDCATENHANRHSYGMIQADADGVRPSNER